MENLLEMKEERRLKRKEGVESWLEGKKKQEAERRRDNHIDGDGSCIARWTI